MLSSRLIFGEANEVTGEDVAAARAVLKEDLNGLSQKIFITLMKQLFFYRMMPRRSVIDKSTKAVGVKIQKDCITVFTGCNATGTHSLTPLVIGKYKWPRCFGSKGSGHFKTRERVGI
jgi:ribosomal protein L9